MIVDIRDADALRAVLPTTQKVYALVAGWSTLESFGDQSYVYAVDEMPEIILPRTELFGDYPSAVSELIDTCTRIGLADELVALRRSGDRRPHVIRVRVMETSLVTRRDIQVSQWQYWNG